MKKKNNIILRLILSAFLIAIGVLAFVFETDIEYFLHDDKSYSASADDFKMTVIDVGQGDSIYLEFCDNKNMLIDCGKGSEVEKLTKFLDDRDIEKIDTLLFTHADEDHVGGGYEIFNNYEILNLYRPKLLSKSENEIYGNTNNYNIKDMKAYDKAIMAAYDEGCEIYYSQRGMEINGADYKITFLSPEENNYPESNDYSAVLLLEIHNKKILLTGDAESNIEEDLIEDYGNLLDVDILKVSHHGSKGASSQEFLDIVTPEIALISVGENQWNMPNDETIARLNLVDTEKIYTTIENGDICAVITQDGNIYINEEIVDENFDLPIIFSVLFVAFLLVWGIRKPAHNSKK